MPLYRITKRRQLFGSVKRPGDIVNLDVDPKELASSWKDFLEVVENKTITASQGE